jgi:hypothetical protein
MKGAEDLSGTANGSGNSQGTAISQASELRCDSAVTPSTINDPKVIETSTDCEQSPSKAACFDTSGQNTDTDHARHLVVQLQVGLRGSVRRLGMIGGTVLRRCC